MTKEQVARNPIMPEKFDDENDENHNIQHVKINKPDFCVKEPSSSKTISTVEDSGPLHKKPSAPQKRLSKVNIPTLATKGSPMKEPLSPASFKSNNKK